MNIPEVERAILGGAMMGDGAFHVVVGEGVVGDTFTLDSHRRLWQVMVDLADRGEPIDTLTVCRSCQVIGAEQFEGIGYVSSLADKCPSSEALVWLCKQSLEATRRRNLRHRLADAVQALQEGSIIDEVIADVSAGFSDLASGQDRLVTGAGLAELLWSSVTQDDEAPMRLGDRALDDVFRSLLCRPRLGVLGGRPGSGKTALALNLLYMLANKGYGCAMLSMEQPARQIAMRLCAIDGAQVLTKLTEKPRGVDPKQWHGERWGDVVDFHEHLATLPLCVDDKPAQTLGYIRSRLVRLAGDMRARGQELRFVVLDYIQRAGLGDGDNLNQRIGAFCIGLADLCRELNISMLALCQLNRQIEKRESKGAAIRLDDFKDSGTIEDSADWMAGVWRDGRRDQHKDDQTMQINVCKNRHGKDGTRAVFDWRGEYLQVRGR